MDNGEQPAGRSVAAWHLVTLMLIWLVAGGSAYSAYRIVTFTDSIFSADSAAAPRSVPPPPLPVVKPEPTQRPPTAVVPAGSAGRQPTPAPRPTATATPEPVPAGGLAGRIRAGQRTSFLLIGYSGPGHDGPYLTDALVVGSYEPATGTLALFNLPRDLWVQAPQADGRPGGPYRKINEVFSLGLGTAALGEREPTAAEVDRAAWLTANVAEQVLGLPIHGWLTGDFIAVRQVIDGLGGVTVDIEKSFDDYQYPRHDNATVDAGVMHVHFDAGRQRLSGERALQYVRSRNAVQDGSDFGRARRQQRLLLALKDQLVTPATLPKVFTLMNAVQGHLRTSLSLAETRAILFFGRDRNASVRPVPMVIDADNLLTFATTQAGASILVPRAGYGNYSGIHRFVQGALRSPVPEAPNPARAATR